jgi:hypothetical protein
MNARSSLRIAAVLAVLASPPVTARQMVIPFASGGITAAATADPDEPRRPTNAERPALVRIWKRVSAAPAAFLKMARLRRRSGNGLITEGSSVRDTKLKSGLASLAGRPWHEKRSVAVDMMQTVAARQRVVKT